MFKFSANVLVPILAEMALTMCINPIYLTLPAGQQLHARAFVRCHQFFRIRINCYVDPYPGPNFFSIWNWMVGTGMGGGA